MQFSLRKKTRKKKMNSSNPSYQSMDCVIKWRNRFINSIRIFFICLKMFIMQQKKQLRWVKKNGYMVKTGSTSATPLSYMLASQLCVFDDRTDLKWKWVEKLIVRFCCPNYLVYVMISICDALLSRNLFNDMMHAKWMCHDLTQGIRTINTFIKHIKGYCQ